jgi:hypothetical protein
MPRVPKNRDDGGGAASFPRCCLFFTTMETCNMTDTTDKDDMEKLVQSACEAAARGDAAKVCPWLGRAALPRVDTRTISIGEFKFHLQ